MLQLNHSTAGLQLGDDDIVFHCHCHCQNERFGYVYIYMYVFCVQTSVSLLHHLKTVQFCLPCCVSFPVFGLRLYNSTSLLRASNLVAT